MELMTIAIDRVLEPEVMNSIEESEAYANMDFLSVNTDFVDQLIQLGDCSGHFLDIGTGPAQIPILLAQRQPQINITAVDLSEEMLKIAEKEVQSANLSQRVTLQMADAKKLPFPDDYFDGVFSNSVIHHIPEPIEVMLEVKRVLKPNGLIFFRDLKRLKSVDTINTIVNKYAKDETEHQRSLFRDSLFDALTVEEMTEIIRSVGLEATVTSSSDRHWSIEHNSK